MVMTPGGDIYFGNDRLMSIEDVRKEYNELYPRYNLNGKLMLKAWLYHSESRIKNNHIPFNFNSYSRCIEDSDILEQVKIGMIDCSDLGGKEEIITYLLKRIQE